MPSQKGWQAPQRIKLRASASGTRDQEHTEREAEVATAGVAGTRRRRNGV